MKKTFEATGKTEEAAILSGLSQLNLERDNVSVTVLERPKKGLLGIGSTPARVMLEYEVPDDLSETDTILENEVQAHSVNDVQPQDESVSPPRTMPREDESQTVSVQGGESTSHHGQEEVYDEIAAQIRTYVSGLCNHLECEVTVHVYLTDEGYYQVILEGSRIGALIGRRGETLDAIQQLTNYSVNRKVEPRCRIRMDAENYRARREETLNALARKIAAKVIRNRRNVTLEPMNAYERHVIHTALQDYDGVSTSSIGSEPNRRIVVKPVY